MILIGAMSDEEERTTLLLVAKIFLVEERVFKLARRARNKNENNNKEKNK